MCSCIVRVLKYLGVSRKLAADSDSDESDDDDWVGDDESDDGGAPAALDTPATPDVPAAPAAGVGRSYVFKRGASFLPRTLTRYACMITRACNDR